MAGKGGAWKVAYADFVTAMMAFFLVMWLISQDQKVKDSIARYFMEPVGFALTGSSMQPSETGGLRDIDRAGPAPSSRTRSGGRGLGTTESENDPDNETAVFSEWLFDDPEMSRRWQNEATQQIEAAREQFPGVENRQLQQQRYEAARRQLALQMRAASLDEARNQSAGVYHELLLAGLSRVDWDLLADEFLQDASEKPRW